MKIRELMTQNPLACSAADSCAVAIDIMKKKNCGFVPVVDNSKAMHVVGVLTDRDVALHLLSQPDASIREISVDSCMTRQPKTLGPEASFEEAVRLMENSAVHRLPIVEGGRLVGVLSLKDIALYAVNHHETPDRMEPTEKQIAEMIEAIAVAR